MESSKQTTLIAFNKKVKSPYALQYLEFQERLKGGKRGKQKLPTLQPNARKSTLLPHCDNYLDLAHELINNKQRLWFCEDKENLPTIESNEEVMNNIKQKISRMKNHSQQNHLHPRNAQHSEQLTKEALPKEISAKSNPNPSKNGENSIRGSQKQYQPALSVEGGLRSRVHSEAMRPPSSGKGSVVTFLQYKKSKRELSIRLRREGV